MTVYVIGPTGDSNWPPEVEPVIDASGNKEYPCRCGETHKGDYALYGWAHHNCFHNDPLHEIDPENVPGYLMCPACGKTFWVKREEVSNG